MGLNYTYTPFRIKCPVHGDVCLTEKEYNRQVMRPDLRWLCPVEVRRDTVCDRPSEWDDEWFEFHQRRWFNSDDSEA